MEEENKLPLKRVELSLTKFNEVAIPHHLDLLRQHKTNIIKYEESREYARVRSEQTHARRVAAQLRALLAELEALRRQVRREDLARFDQLTARSRDLTLRSIMDYLGVIERSCCALVQSARAGAGARARGHESSPLPTRRAAGAAASAEASAAASSTLSTDSVGVVAHCADPGSGAEQAQLQLDEQERELRAREAALRGWAELQAEVRALHDAWQHVQAAALASRALVDAAEGRAHAAADNVGAARGALGAAERLRAGAYGAGGALAGAALGGPVGLLVGAKAGALAALLAAGLGYLGGRALRRGQLAASQHKDC